MNKPGGFTLIEVLAAIVLLGLAAAFSTSAVDLMSTNYSTSRRLVQAHNIAVAQMETLLSAYNSDVNLSNGAHAQQYDIDGNPVAAGGAYNATWNVQSDTPVTSIMSIQLSVRWTESGAQHTVHLITFRGG